MVGCFILPLDSGCYGPVWSFKHWTEPTEFSRCFLPWHQGHRLLSLWALTSNRLQGSIRPSICNILIYLNLQHMRKNITHRYAYHTSWPSCSWIQQQQTSTNLPIIYRDMPSHTRKSDFTTRDVCWSVSLTRVDVTGLWVSVNTALAPHLLPSLTLQNMRL